ncbi:MAG: HAD family hydrolase [Bdellovibrionales bacterium]|nr:HAD family hydrolase [Bdellovibrionales bacterium]
MSLKLRKPTLLFDLDGTLTDPWIGITRSIVYALEKLGAPAPPQRELIWCIGPPLKKSFETLLGPARAGEADRALSLYRETYEAQGIFENVLYDGIPELLAAVKNAGAFVSLATSKPRVYAERILEHFEIQPYFDAVHGSELDDSRSDKAEVIAHAVKTERLDPAKCLMIGDREFDAIGARKNGMPCLGALWGHGNEAELRANGVTEFFRTPAELQEYLLY